MRDNPVIATVALITTTVLVCGSVFGLLRPSISTEGPSSEAQNSIGATVMSACQNLIDEIPDSQSVSFESPLVPKLHEIDRWTDGLIDMVNNEINHGTQAASLEQMRECIDNELKEGALKPFRSRLKLMVTHLQRSGFGVDPRHLPVIREKFNESIRLANGIHEKLKNAVDQITTEINRQHARPIPRIG
jgi:hypothetical protein